MKKIFSLALGIIASLGGFVDIGDLVFNAQAGAKFGYSLLWALILGTIGIMVFGEMSGRIAAVTKKATFDLIRDDLPARLGFFTLVMSTFANMLTCAAEIGGVALVLTLLSNYSYFLLIVVAMLAIVVIVWFLPFTSLEKLFGYLGVGLLVFVVVAIKTWPGVAFIHGLVPKPMGGATLLTYCYFIVGLIAATMMPFEAYFYSSGGIEEGWKPEDARTKNRMNSLLGFGVGIIAAGGIMVTAGNVLLPQAINPQFVGTTAASVGGTLGSAGVVIALIGMLFAIGGATVETSFSCAYNLSQYARWEWGKMLSPRKVPRFTLAWMITLLIGASIVFIGIDPVALTDYAVIFSVVIMPLTFYPILRTARDKNLMGEYVNGRFANIMGWIFMFVVSVVALAAIPLLFITGRGQ